MSRSLDSAAIYKGVASSFFFFFFFFLKSSPVVSKDATKTLFFSLKVKKKKKKKKKEKEEEEEERHKTFQFRVWWFFVETLNTIPPRKIASFFFGVYKTGTVIIE